MGAARLLGSKVGISVGVSTVGVVGFGWKFLFSCGDEYYPLAEWVQNKGEREGVLQSYVLLMQSELSWHKLRSLNSFNYTGCTRLQLLKW